MADSNLFVHGQLGGHPKAHAGFGFVLPADRLCLAFHILWNADIILPFIFELLKHIGGRIPVEADLEIAGADLLDPANRGGIPKSLIGSQVQVAAQAQVGVAGGFTHAVMQDLDPAAQGERAQVDDDPAGAHHADGLCKGMHHARGRNSSKRRGVKNCVEGVAGEGQVLALCSDEVHHAGIFDAGFDRFAQAGLMRVNGGHAAGKTRVLPGQLCPAAADLQDALAGDGAGCQQVADLVLLGVNESRSIHKISIAREKK